MNMLSLTVRALLSVLGLTLSLSAAAPATKPQSGLVLAFTTGTQTDTVTAPNVWLYVPAGQPPTPFLSPGPFRAVWEGFIAVDLRGDFLFRVETRGTVTVELGTNIVIQFTGDGTKASDSTKPIRLGKGQNALKVTFTSPAGSDAFVRLLWSERGFIWEPIQSGMLGHATGPAALVAADQLRLGRELFLESRCAKCHSPGTSPALPELAMDAPSFEGIGSRRHAAWLAGWILDPKAQRPSARMPQLLHGATAPADAAAIAAFLGAEKSPAPVPEFASTGKAIESGRNLAEALHCAGCHSLPGSKGPDGGKISLAHVNAKFPPGQLVAFLQNPTAHFAWNRMPNFQLKPAEAMSLAAFLAAGAAPAAPAPTTPADPAQIARGKHLVQTTGCLNCHSLKLDDSFPAAALVALPASKWNRGCLTDDPAAAARSPHFRFTADERDALRAFAATDRAALSRHVPVEFAARQARNYNCTSCHGELDGFTTFDKLGGKLKPEWMEKFLAGELNHKPRPWLMHRMPVFPQLAKPFATGLAMTHGLPPTTPAEPPPDPAQGAIGRKLTGTDGGFSCTSCHAVGEQKATQVFESEGLNLAYPADRMQRAYFERWMRNPLRIEPQTKMPVYFQDDGTSPLQDVLGGDSAKQVDAFWQYLRQGKNIEPPAGQ